MLLSSHVGRSGLSSRRQNGSKPHLRRAIIVRAKRLDAPQRDTQIMVLVVVAAPD